MRFGAPVVLPPAPAGWFDAHQAVLADGTLALVRTADDFRGEYGRWARGEGPRPRRWSEPQPTRISVFDGVAERDAFEVSFGAVPLVDRFPDGRWLLGGSRSDPGEQNACVFAPDGAHVASLALGDAVEHAQCAADGSIWAGYWDEGVFAGADPDGSYPVSTAGVARFAADGTVAWRFNDARGEAPLVDDCYALALDGDVVWFCAYSVFAIVRVENGRVRAWRNEITGAKAIAAGGGHVLLAGGYEGARNRLVLLRLEDDGAVAVASCSNEPVLEGAGLVQGRGSVLHVVSGCVWRTLDVLAAPPYFTA